MAGETLLASEYTLGDPGATMREAEAADVVRAARAVNARSVPHMVLEANNQMKPRFHFRWPRYNRAHWIVFQGKQRKRQ